MVAGDKPTKQEGLLNYSKKNESVILIPPEKRYDAEDEGEDPTL
jgi:hypothetical protein